MPFGLIKSIKSEKACSWPLTHPELGSTQDDVPGMRWRGRRGLVAERKSADDFHRRRL